MKKWMSGLLILLLCLSIGGTIVLAAGKPENSKGGCMQGENFIDEDGDGICDNQGSQHGNRGENFVDEDEDGICDNRGTEKCGSGSGKANGCGKGNGSGKGNGCGKGKCNN